MSQRYIGRKARSVYITHWHGGLSYTVRDDPEFGPVGTHRLLLVTEHGVWCERNMKADHSYAFGTDESGEGLPHEELVTWANIKAIDFTLPPEER